MTDTTAMASNWWTYSLAPLAAHELLTEHQPQLCKQFVVDHPAFWNYLTTPSLQGVKSSNAPETARKALWVSYSITVPMVWEQLTETY